VSVFTQYTDLYPLMAPELPGCPAPVMLQALQRAGVQFCEDSEAWLENDLEPQPIVDYQKDYTISHGKDASIRRIQCVNVNGVPRPPCEYELVTGNVLRFSNSATPNTLENRMLKCGASPLTTVAGWTAITDGSVGITVYQSTYALTALDFSGCTTMAQVALVIQNALRVAMSSNSATVRWYTDHFVVLADTGTADYLTAGTAGTDISGAGHMNGLTGGDATLAPWLKIDVILVPLQAATGMPTNLIEQWRSAIIGEAMFRLMTMEKVAWANGNRAALYKLDYRMGLSRAKNERDRGHKRISTIWGA